jgi:hypothetical protein
VSTLVEMPAGDVDGDALGFELIDAPLKSDVIQEGSVLLLTPHAGASGVDSLRFRASDGALESAAATVTIRYVGATGASSDVTITASPAPIVCGGETITLDGGEGISWVWSTGATTRTIEVSRSGAYGVTVEVAPGRQVFGSIEVWVGEPGLLLEVALQGLTRSVERSLSVTVGDCEGMVAARDVAAAFSESGEAELAMVDFGFEPTWVSVTEGHALRGVAAADVDGCGIARVSLTGGNALLSGDLQTAMMPKDDFVDVADFAILAVHWGMGVDPESAYGADINGDGIQGAADFTAILVNYFESGDGAYCGVKAAGEGSSWIAADTLSSAMRRAADRDGNGRVDGRDMLLFADELRIDIAPSLRMKLERMARTTRD